MSQTRPTAVPPVERAYPVLVHLVTAGVLLQAVLAGQFLAGTAGGLVTAHEIVGNALFLLVLVQAAAAVLLVRADRLAATHAWAGAGLVVALTAQIGLGYVPGAATTAVHIPLGVALFGAATWLSVTVTTATAAAQR